MHPSRVMMLSSQGFAWIDWAIVLGYFAFSTWLGGRMAGKQSTIRDFFLGGRKLPWYAVSGSIVATEISAMTFVVVPFMVFRPGGNLTYLQLGVFGSLLARFIVGYLLIPEYYKRELYSPYDYMGHKLGRTVRSMTTALFTLGGVLAQSARVYLTAVVLNVIIHDELVQLTHWLGLSPLVWSIVIIGGIATAWTLIGGITTVIWTDVLLFMMFLLGAAAALIAIAWSVPDGFMGIIGAGLAAGDGSGPSGKFTFFDTTTEWPGIFTQPYTIWAAVIAATWGSLHPYGVDQLIVQRMFCCRNPAEARKALISSFAGQLVTFTVAFVGIGLYAYYQRYPLSGTALALYEEKPDRIFPLFVVYSGAIPAGLKGLIIAGIFAAAISSLTSILAALSQTTLSAFSVMDERDDAAGAGDRDMSRRAVVAGRLLVLMWGVVLCVFAHLAQFVSEKYPTILDLGQAMAGYAGGALLAGFFLSFLPLKVTGTGYMWAAPLSVFYVFAVVWHAPWSQWVCAAAGMIILLSWGAAGCAQSFRRRPRVLPYPVQTLILLAAVVGMLAINRWGYWRVESLEATGRATNVIIAWPWYVPIGSTVAFVLSYLLATRRGQFAGDADGS